MLESLVLAIVYIIIVGIIFWLLNWALSQVPLPEPFNKVAHVLIVLIACLLVIYILLGLVGTVHVGRL